MTRHTPIRLLIHGARGKMGARIAALARHDSRFSIAAERDRDDALDAATPCSCDAIVDFSSDAGARHAAHLAARQRAALLVGTTGLSAETLGIIEQAARSCPVMIAANTSRGVAVFRHLITQAARLLGPDFDIDLIEAHHSAKKDAPSGTALRLIETLKRDAGVELPPDRVHCLRAGDIVGDHTLQLAGPGETITISHSATTRDVFALGALRAIDWLASQKPGRYTIEQSLGLEETSKRPNG
jgi:4-hydroxy-tetrahydrodipicolinate reductase